MRSATTSPLILVFALAVAACLSEGAWAQTGSQLLLRPFRTADHLEVDADALFLFSTDAESQITPGDEFDFRADVYDLNGRVRLTPGSETRGFARAQPRAGFSTRYLQLHADSPLLPDELFDGSAAVAMGVLSRGGWIGGISLGGGYAGADFEEDGNALYLQGNFVLGKTFENGDVFGLVLDYDGNRSFLPDVPLPGFQYRKRFGPPPAPPEPMNGGARAQTEVYDPSAAPAPLVVALGLPFSGIEWRPTERLTVELTYSAPQNLTARADFTLMGDRQTSGAGIYASLNRSITAVHWNELPDRDRLFFRQSLAEAGVNWRLHDRLELVVAGGWAFGQEFVTGWDTRDTDDVAEVDGAPYVRALARLRL